MAETKPKRKSVCKGCGAEIRWMREGSKSTPFDPDGTNHFVTCPKRDQFRKKVDPTLREVSDALALLKSAGSLMPRLYAMRISEIMAEAKEINAKETEALW